MKEKLSANILFSGIGCQERGIINTGLFDLEVVSTADIDKEAIVSYAAIHCGLTKETIESYQEYPSKEEMAQYLTDLNIGYNPDIRKPYDWFKFVKRKSNDIRKYYLACKLSKQKGDIERIKELPYADLWTISFCCQDISVAGKMKGLSPNSGTRSSLLWKNIELLKKSITKGESPKYLMFENVKNLVGKKFINDFKSLLGVLNELGFNTYWKVLNGKECGVPQNRERVFVVSIRKDIDKGSFEFPKPFDSGLRLRDVLEDCVENKYYLSKEIAARFKLTDPTLKHNVVGTTLSDSQLSTGQRYVTYYKNSIIGGLCATDYKQPKQILEICSNYDGDSLKQVGYLGNNSDANRVYADNISRTLKAEAGGGGAKTGWYLVDNEQSYIDNVPDKCSFVKRKIQQILDNNGSIPEMFNVYADNEMTDYAPTLTTYCGNNTPSSAVLKKEFGYRIRKLTPIECWRLMGLTFNDCLKARSVGVADCNLYKQAGNGIITNCVELIMEHLYKSQYDENYICLDENIER